MSARSVLLSGIPLIALGCASLSPNPAVEQRTNLTPSNSVWFTGSSNIRSFSCRATLVAVSAEAALEDFERTNADGVTAVKSGGLAIPVESLDCGIRKMNDDLFRTLGGEKDPLISFRLTDYRLLERGVPTRVRLLGALRVAGREREMVMHGTLARDETGDLRLRGEREINVRDFGVKPPRRFLGVMRVRDEITVHFDVAVRPLVDPMSMLTSIQ